MSGGDSGVLTREKGGRRDSDFGVLTGGDFGVLTGGDSGVLTGEKGGRRDSGWGLWCIDG